MGRNQIADTFKNIVCSLLLNRGSLSFSNSVIGFNGLWCDYNVLYFGLLVKVCFLIIASLVLVFKVSCHNHGTFNMVCPKLLSRWLYTLSGISCFSIWLTSIAPLIIMFGILLYVQVAFLIKVQIKSFYSVSYVVPGFVLFIVSLSAALCFSLCLSIWLSSALSLITAFGLFYLYACKHATDYDSFKLSSKKKSIKSESLHGYFDAYTINMSSSMVFASKVSLIFALFTMVFIMNCTNSYSILVLIYSSIVPFSIAFCVLFILISSVIMFICYSIFPNVLLIILSNMASSVSFSRYCIVSNYLNYASGSYKSLSLSSVVYGLISSTSANYSLLSSKLCIIYISLMQYVYHKMV